MASQEQSQSTPNSTSDNILRHEDHRPATKRLPQMSAAAASGTDGQAAPSHQAAALEARWAAAEKAIAAESTNASTTDTAPSNVSVTTAKQTASGSTTSSGEPHESPSNGTSVVLAGANIISPSATTIAAQPDVPAPSAPQSSISNAAVTETSTSEAKPAANAMQVESKAEATEADAQEHCVAADVQASQETHGHEHQSASLTSQATTCDEHASNEETDEAQITVVEPQEELDSIEPTELEPAETNTAESASVEDVTEDRQAAPVAEDLQTAEAPSSEYAELDTSEGASAAASSNSSEIKLYQAEPEQTESEVAESEVAESEVAESEVAESEVAESEVAESEVAESEVAESEVAESEVAESEVAESEIAALQLKELDEETSGEGIAFIEQLEKKHNQVLDELDALNAKIESVLESYLQSRKKSEESDQNESPKAA